MYKLTLKTFTVEKNKKYMAFNLFYFLLSNISTCFHWLSLRTGNEYSVYTILTRIILFNIFVLLDNTNERILFVFNFHSKLCFSDNLNSFSMLFLKQILFFISMRLCDLFTKKMFESCTIISLN